MKQGDSSQSLLGLSNLTHHAKVLHNVSSKNTVVEDQSEMTSAQRRIGKRESMEDFKQKLVRLEKNKSDLESKMKEFEQKIKSYST